jgi:hypothetical protein
VGVDVCYCSNSDVRVILNEGFFTSHRIILAAASPILADLIRRAPAPAAGSDGIVTIEWKHTKFGLTHFQELINSIYSGVPIAMNAETAIPWLELANSCKCPMPLHHFLTYVVYVHNSGYQLIAL